MLVNNKKTNIFLMFHKISFKLFLFVFILGIIPLLLSSYFLVQIFEKSLIESALDEVELLADAQEGSTLIYLESLKKRTIDFSTDGLIENFLFKIRDEESETEKIKEVSLINQHLLKNKLVLDENLLGINITNLDGKVIASTNDKEIDRQINHDNFWLQTIDSKMGEAIISDLGQFNEFQSKNGVIAVSSYIFNSDTDQQLGLIVNYFNTDVFDEILIGEYQLKLGAITGLQSKKETLDIYMVNKDKLMISASRFFGDEVIFKQLVDTVPIRGCLDNKEELTGIWDDYRGIPVIGSGMCLPYHDWVLIVEIDVEEIMKPIIILERNIIIGISALLILIIIAGIFFIRGISKPIVNLTKITENISKGMLDIKIDTVSRKDEIGLLSNSFSKMANSLKLQEKEKYEFITSASHQLRTPASGVRQQLQLLKENIKKLSPDSQVISDIESLIDNNLRVIKTINDLFKILELGNSYTALNLVDTKIKDMVNLIVNSFEEDITKKMLEVDVDISPDLMVKVEKTRFKDALLNLIENAVNYSSSGGKIKISAKQQNKQIFFEISDTGIGIPKKEQVYIFDRFFRAKNSYAKSSVGTGLGLSIVKAIIEGHNGKIRFRSEENKGTTFVFTLPM